MSGTSFETISVQSSPPESLVMSPKGEAATLPVCVSNAVPVPSAQTVRYRRYVHVTPTVPQKTLPTKPSVVAWTQRPGPTFQEFHELQRMVQQTCNDGKGGMFAKKF